MFLALLKTDVKNLQPETETMILISMFHIAIISALLRHTPEAAYLEGHSLDGKKAGLFIF